MPKLEEQLAWEQPLCSVISLTATMSEAEVHLILEQCIYTKFLPEGSVKPSEIYGRLKRHFLE